MNFREYRDHQRFISNVRRTRSLLGLMPAAIDDNQRRISLMHLKSAITTRRDNRDGPGRSFLFPTRVANNGAVH